MKKDKNGFGAAKCFGVCFVLVMGLSIFCFLPSADAQYGHPGFSGDINFLAGVKELDDYDWEPLEEQREFGVDFDCKLPGWPISMVFGLTTSYDDSDWDYVEFEGRTSEFYGGIRKIFFEDQMIRPYIGGGLNIIYAEIEANDYYYYYHYSDDDSDVGFWLGGGLYITLPNHLNLGFNIMYSEAEVDMAGYEFDAGGVHYSFLVGYHW